MTDCLWGGVKNYFADFFRFRGTVVFDGLPQAYLNSHTHKTSVYMNFNTHKKNYFFALLITMAIGQFQFSTPNVSLASLLAFPAELEHFNAWPGFHSSSISCCVCLFVYTCVCISLLFLCSAAITSQRFNHISYT